MTSFRTVPRLAALAAATCGFCAAPALAQNAQRPQYLVIMGDDVGLRHRRRLQPRLMCPRPTSTAIAREGVLFTDHTLNPSCTAGRSSFITGQLADPHRPAHSRPARFAGGHRPARPDARQAAEGAGLPHGAVRQEPTSATVTEHLPTVERLDEFYGNLYTSTPRRSPSCALDQQPASQPLSPGVAYSIRGHERRTTSQRGPSRASAAGAKQR